jgi:D-alanyl-D-alanine carboxypeptidase (penicillin-binding protein 5/6)
MQKIRSHRSTVTSQGSAAEGLRAGLFFCLLAVGGCLCSCDDPAKLNMAVEALKAREDKVEVREAASQEREEQFAERERQLAAATASLERQRAELETLKKKLLDDIAETKRRQEALLLREKRGPAPAVTAQRVAVIDPVSGEILAEKNSNRREQVASTQKLLTALIIIEAGGLDEMVTIEKEDSNCAPVKITLNEGDKYSRRQLLATLMVKSFNNIARALARDNAGSPELFAEKMNARAKALGMNDSHFVNPNGLPDEEQYSTAHDMALLAKAADALPELRDMVSTRKLEWKRASGGVDLFENTNRVLRTCEFCDGMKTGYTDAAGHCLVASGEKDGRRRIVVVLGDTTGAVWKDAQALLEWSLKG